MSRSGNLAVACLALSLYLGCSSSGKVESDPVARLSESATVADKQAALPRSSWHPSSDLVNELHTDGSGLVLSIDPHLIDDELVLLLKMENNSRELVRVPPLVLGYYLVEFKSERQELLYTDAIRDMPMLDEKDLTALYPGNTLSATWVVPRDRIVAEIPCEIRVSTFGNYLTTDGDLEMFKMVSAWVELEED